MNIPRRDLLPALTIFILSLLVNLLLVPYGINLWDEGIPLNGAIRVLEGQQVFRDFHGYPPGIYALYASVFSIWKTDLHAVRIVMACITAIMPLLAFSITRRFTSTIFACVPAVLLIFLPGIYCNRLSTLFLLINLRAHIASVTHERAGLSGLWITVFVTAFYNVEIAFVSALAVCIELMFVMTSKKMRHTMKLSVIMLAGILLAIIAGLRMGMGPEFYKPVLRINKFSQQFRIFPGIPWPFDALSSKGEHSQGNESAGINGLAHMPLSGLRIKELWFLYIFMVMVLYRIIGVFRKWLHPPDDRDNLRAESILVSYAAISLIPVFMRFGYGYMVRYLPPVYVLITVMTWAAWKNKQYFSFALMCGILTVYLVNGTWNHGFEAGSTGVVRECPASVKIQGTDIRCDTAHKIMISEVCSYIQENVDETTPILALPYNPIWYFLTRRHNPTYYDWVLPGLVSREEELKMIESISENPPGIIVYIDIALDGKEERRMKNYLPELYRYIVAHYHPRARSGPFFLLEPRE